jgi:hypothetical protein
MHSYISFSVVTFSSAVVGFFFCEKQLEFSCGASGFRTTCTVIKMLVIMQHIWNVRCVYESMFISLIVCVVSVVTFFYVVPCKLRLH